MLYKVLSLHHEEENALFFSVRKPWHRLFLVDLIYVLYRIGLIKNIEILEISTFKRNCGAASVEAPVKHENLVLSNELIKVEFGKLTFRALALCQSESVEIFMFHSPTDAAPHFL